LNRTEIVLAAIGLISVVALAGVSIGYSNLLATQQQNTNLLLYYYFNIPPTPYGITFYVTNNTDPKNQVLVTKKITINEFLCLKNSTFSWMRDSTMKYEVGPSLYTVLLTYFGLDITNITTLQITVIGPEATLVYNSSVWEEKEINESYPLLDYAEGGGGGAQLYLGTMKLCAPPDATSKITPVSPPTGWIPRSNWVKGVQAIQVVFS